MDGAGLSHPCDLDSLTRSKGSGDPCRNDVVDLISTTNKNITFLNVIQDCRGMNQGYLGINSCHRLRPCNSCCDVAKSNRFFSRAGFKKGLEINPRPHTHPRSRHHCCRRYRTSRRSRQLIRRNQNWKNRRRRMGCLSRCRRCAV